MIRVFHHEEVRERANEYWLRVERERFKAYDFNPVPPPAFTKVTLPPYVEKTREEWEEIIKQDYTPCSDEELAEFVRTNSIK